MKYHLNIIDGKLQVDGRMIDENGNDVDYSSSIMD